MSRCSKVAAATAAVVPFSCVVCFEEFNTTDRPPMVLPCGHTYVCMMCSKRLKKCMECREPLFIHAPRKPQNTYVRGRYSPTPSTPPQAAPSPTQPIPLPIPKNLVLLAMMEAAERNRNLMDASSESSEGEEDEEAFDLNQIISGMSTLAGPCGTYAVKSDSPLPVLRYDPRREEGEEKKIEDESEPYLLERGQTVQVVEFDDSVAVLARGQGFIIADHSQLVKVGGPLDSSCRLEGVLRTIEDRGFDLARTLEDNNTTAESLRAQIAAEREKEPSHPIITEIQKRDDEAPRTPTSPSTPISQPKFAVYDHSAGDLAIPSSGSMDSMVEVDENGNSIYRGQNACTHSPNSIDNADIVNNTRAMLRQTASADDTFNHFVFGCGSGLFGQSSIFSTQNTLGRSASAQRVRSSSGDVAALSDRPHNRIGPASSFDTVSSRPTGLNFRTGFSGHRGLFSTKTSRGGERPRGQIRMMGEHRGVAGGVRRNSPSSSPSNGRSFQTISDDF